MGQRPKRRLYIILLLAACVASRLATTIYYVEDTDSLRFALSVHEEFDVAGLQPHFPGYPVFWFLAKLLYLSTGSFAVAFSIIGGAATFVIAYFLMRLAAPAAGRPPTAAAAERHPTADERHSITDDEPSRITADERHSITAEEPHSIAVETALIAGLVFFNPLIWLMGNRYMPDLAALALALAAFYFLVSEDRREIGFRLAGRLGGGRGIGFALTGLLAGLRLSYVPFVMIPLGVAFFTGGRRLRDLVFLAAGIVVWLLPLIADTGWQTLIDAAGRQTEGHFTEFGGTVETNPDLFVRAVRTVEAVWADGLGGYWSDRHWLTLLVGGGLLLVLLPGLQRGVDRLRTDRTLQLLLASTFVYGLWMLFFQNVIYKTRHVLPILPVLLLIVGWGARDLLRSKWKGLQIATVVFLAAYAAVGVVLALQHRSPTAIAQAKEHLEERVSPEDVVVSIPLVNYYLSAQGLEAQYVSVEDTAAVAELTVRGDRAFVVGRFPELPLANPARSDTFYHNPYVNRMWPDVQVHVYDP